MTYRDVLRHRSLLTLVGSFLVTSLGFCISQVALAVVVFERTSSPLLSTLTFTLGMTPYLLSAYLVPRLEHVPGRTLLVACAVVQAAAYVAMAVPGMPIVAVLALLFLGGLVSATASGTRAALLPEIVGAGEGYVLGRSLMRLVSQSSQILGLAVGGALLLVLPPDGLLLLTAAACAGSALVLRMGLPVLPGLVRAASTRATGRTFADPARSRLVLLGWIVPTVAVASEALAVPYVASLGLPPGRAGLLLWAGPAGTVLAELLTVRFLTQPQRERAMVPLAALVIVAPLGYAFHPGAVIAAALLGVSSLGFGYTMGLDARTLAVTPAALRRRVLSTSQSGMMVLQGLGFALAGGLAQVVPVQLVAPMISAAGLLLLAVLVRGLRAHEPAGRRAGGARTHDRRIMSPLL